MDVIRKDNDEDRDQDGAKKEEMIEWAFRKEGGKHQVVLGCCQLFRF